MLAAMDFRGPVRTVLQCLMIGFGAILLARLVRWVAGRYRGPRRRLGQGQDQAGRGRLGGDQTARTVGQVIEWVVQVVVIFLAAVLIIDRTGIPLSRLVVPATAG